MTGTAPAVRAMFNSIAPRYDILNHLLSLNLDRGWRRAALDAVATGRGDRVLDTCAGTLDLALGHAARGASVMALDFCRDMLLVGQRKALHGGHPVPLVEADAMRVPFPDACFDAATVAFGVRNLDRPRDGLGELARVLRPGGRLGVLEFCRPRSALVRAVYYPYFRHILPRLGRVISGHRHAYTYLPDSVMTFLDPEQLAATLAEHGMRDVGVRRLTLGTVALVTAVRS